MTIFAERIKSLMEEKHLSQSKLAASIGLTRAAVNRYVSGLSEPSFNTLVLIAKMLECSVDYLIGRTELKVSHDRFYFNDEISLLLRSSPESDGTGQEYKKTCRLYVAAYSKSEHSSIVNSAVKDVTVYIGGAYDMYAVTGAGAECEPFIPANASIIVERTDMREVINNKVYAVRFHKYDEVGLHFRICQKFGNTLVLSTADKSEEDIFDLTAIDFNPISGTPLCIIKTFAEIN